MCSWNLYLSVEHNAYQLQGQSYVKSAAILATSAEYNNPLRLKSATRFYNPVTGFSLQRTESYGYDQDFDYSTSVNYGDGSAVQTWEYDSAGNRSSASANPGSCSYDNLNQMKAFQLYDCHGSMVATVFRSGAGFTTSNVRTYDVWGGVRTGALTGSPKGRYVANLGHVQDDESRSNSLVSF